MTILKRSRILNLMMLLVCVLIALLAAAWLIAMFVFAGKDHSQYDQPRRFFGAPA